MTSLGTLHLRVLSFPPPNVLQFKAELGSTADTYQNWNANCQTQRKFFIRAVSNSLPVPTDTGNNRIREDEYNSNSNTKMADSLNPPPTFQETISSLPPLLFLIKRVGVSNIAIGFSVTVTLLIIAIRVYVGRKSRYSSRPGSVADLVRRGQLNSSDRRGISRGLKYEDPFNNPMVKVDKRNTSVEMCGKIYRLAPVTLTREEQAIHQKRRSRAYQWKRPTIFLKEGDEIPPDVDPDTVRWIPANHPFATTVSDIDEDLAQNNVYQKHGVPFRIQAEHQALQRKLEALQTDKKFKNLGIDPGAAKDFERQFKSNLMVDNPEAQSTLNGEVGSKPPPQSDRTVGNNTSSEEMQKP